MAGDWAQGGPRVTLGRLGQPEAVGVHPTGNSHWLLPTPRCSQPERSAGARALGVRQTAWLCGLSLERYVELFRDNDIDAEILQGMAAEDLKEPG